MSTHIIGSMNPKFGSVVESYFTDRIEALPNSQIACLLFGESVNIEAYRGETAIIRSYNQLEIEDSMLDPLNPAILNEERIASITGSNIQLTPVEYGVTLVFSEKSRMSSPEDMIGGASPLLADMEMRLKENITINMLLGANNGEYEFTKGGTTSPRKANVEDFIKVASIMEKNGATPCAPFIRATDQVSTTPVGKSYVCVTSVKGNYAIKSAIKADEFAPTHHYAGITDYSIISKGSIDRAGVEIMVSSELSDGTETERIGLVLGSQPFYKTAQTPLGSDTYMQPASNTAYRYHRKLDKVTSFGVAQSNQNRVLKVIFA